MIKTAIVILNWNGHEMLKEFLPDVVKFSEVPDTKVYVADNASSDNSVEFIKNSFPDVEIIQLEQNYGFAGGYNRALNQIEAKYFVLLNSDVRVTENWVQPIVSLLESNPDIAAVQPKILSLKEPEYFEYAGAAGGLIDKYGYCFCRGRLFNVLEKDEGQYNSEAEIFWASGAALFIRADLYKSSGGLDEDFFAHMEEIDLCWRMKNMGYKIFYSPKSSVYHLGGGTLPKNNPKKTYLNFRNNLFLLYKNYQPNEISKLLYFRLILDGIAAIKFLVGFSFKEFWAVIKAHRSFFKMLPEYKKDREKHQRRFTKFSTNELFNGSIVWQFYARGIKSFQKLKN